MVEYELFASRLTVNPARRTCERTTSAMLKSSTAISGARSWLMLFSAGVWLGLSSAALADDQTMIPLEFVTEKNHNGEVDLSRLGIWASINNGKAQRYVFDTGSDQFNTQIGPDVTGVKPVRGPDYVYAYGDGNYGYKIRQVEFDKLIYYDPSDPDKTVENPMLGENKKYQVGRIDSIIYKTDPGGVNLSVDSVTDGLKDVYGEDAGKYYADLGALISIENGEPADEGGNFSGTFGAGDYMFPSSVEKSMLGGATTSGYIVAANTDFKNKLNPGCSPCVIVNLDPSLRAQFASFVPWGKKSTIDQNTFRPTFPGSNANASSEFEGSFSFKFSKTLADKPVDDKAAVLFDTGSPAPASVSLGKEAFDQLNGTVATFKVIDTDDNGKPKTYQATIPQLSMLAEDGQEYKVSDSLATYTVGSTTTTVILGLDFFQNHSVMYDLYNQVTTYSPYFVSANNFTTNSGAGREEQLNKITPRWATMDGWALPASSPGPSH